MNLNNHIQQILTRHGGIRLAILFASLARETLIYSSHRRKPVSSWLISLDSGFRRNDESGINQRLPRISFDELVKKHGCKTMDYHG